MRVGGLGLGVGGATNSSPTIPSPPPNPKPHLPTTSDVDDNSDTRLTIYKSTCANATWLRLIVRFSKSNGFTVCPSPITSRASINESNSRLHLLSTVSCSRHEPEVSFGHQSDDRLVYRMMAKGDRVMRSPFVTRVRTEFARLSESLSGGRTRKILER